jgi:DNA-binding GntR family transcriptional regulator
VSAQLRQRIIDGEYQPGERLTEESLADDFGVSRIPVREALRVLASEGFVRAQPYYGTFVAELTARQANDLLEVRGALEPLAARLAAQRCGAEDLAAMKQVLRQGQRAGKAGRYQDLSGLNGRFHELLAGASGNSSLAALISQLRDKIDWVYSMEVRRRARDSWREHAEIVEAIETGDPDRAASVVADHIREAAAAYRLRAEGHDRARS